MTLENPIPRTARSLGRHFWLPIAALTLLVLVCNFNVWDDFNPARQTRPELLAHDLGHGINSVWVGISILLLVVPSLWVTRRGGRDVWAWRVMDAVLLDFIIVDAIGKRFLPWPRPEKPAGLMYAGFPSGHTMMAFLMAWLIWRRYPRLGPLWFVMATLISWSRVEVHAHFPYQVIAAAFFGCAVGRLICSRETGVIFPRAWLSDAALRARLALSPTSESAARPGFSGNGLSLQDSPVDQRNMIRNHAKVAPK